MPPRGCVKFCVLLAAGLFLLVCGNLRAVQVYGTSGTGSTYTTAPADDFGFENVAQVWDTIDGLATSGVYLGNGWILSAYHEVRDGSGGFEFTNVVLDGSTYLVNASTAVRLTSGTNGAADLAMYRLATIPTDPNLKIIPISASRPPAFASQVLMGDGISRAASLTNWIVTGTNTVTWTWTQTSGTGNFSGYLYSGAQFLRWGTGALSGTDAGQDGFGYVTLFYTIFQSADGSAIGAGGDSGGGVFYKRGSTWELCGTLITVGTYPNQPGSTSVVGDVTYAANLADYASQINSITGIQAPSITGQPSNLSLVETSSGTFAVTASGTPAPSYQWQRMPAGSGTWSNMTDVSGTYAGTATSALVLNNVTLAMNGDRFRCVASNGKPPDATSNSGTLSVISGYTSWAMAKFGSQYSNPAISSATSTPQGDGVANAVKFLTDINPAAPMTSSGYAALPVVGSVTLSGTQYLALTYRQSQSIPGLVLQVQTSADLQSWQTVTPDFTQQTGTDPGTGDPIIQVGVKTNGAQKLFIRLRITVS